VILVTNLCGMGKYPGPITKSFPTAADETEMAGKADTTPPPTVGEPEPDGRGREEKPYAGVESVEKVETNEGTIKVPVVVA